MKLNDAPIFLALMLLLSCTIGAQDKTAREVEVHTNVRLIEMAVPQEIPADLKAKYQQFLPLFEQALKESTSDQSSDNALTFRVVPGVKEVGSAKTKRAVARITAYRKSSKREFIGSLLLHSYATGDMVNKQEIDQFLRRQILAPMGIK
jgi:hypothetical protein